MYLNVIDNFIDYNLLEKEKNIFLYKTPHIWGHSSKGGVKFYSTQIPPTSSFIDYIHKRINQEVLNLNTEITRSYINIQHREMEGEFHIDDGDLTALLMVTDTPNDKGGKFEYKWENNKLQSENFIQNRLILFQEIEHRGCAPTNGEPRITLALKLKFLKNEV
tara:strand:+ start:38 stop:526 length:489 start_codon:yes stop_codon:yes gene_type:complete